jgi:hypothetical protein
MIKPGNERRALFGLSQHPGLADRAAYDVRGRKIGNKSAVGQEHGKPPCIRRQNITIIGTVSTQLNSLCRQPHIMRDFSIIRAILRDRIYKMYIWEKGNGGNYGQYASY